MGNVYLAVRHAEYRQQVAIKVLRRGTDTESILQRFRNEIQVLAAVSKHENIAGLLDAGTTEDGLPFFVMEYVEGEPLDRYCDHHRYGVKDRVRIFREVCAAVQFSHQHMIVHRDLKMSNILVRTEGVPKLIDFGIAKLTTPEFGVETMAPTMPDTNFMTLEYASPESEIDVFELDLAMRKLAEFDERKSRIVELHFFGGLNYDETAAALDISAAIVHRDLRLAKAWLHRELAAV